VTTAATVSVCPWTLGTVSRSLGAARFPTRNITMAEGHAQSPKAPAVAKAMLTLQTYFTKYEKEKLAWSRERIKLQQRIRELEAEVARQRSNNTASATSSPSRAGGTIRTSHSGGFAAGTNDSKASALAGLSPDKKYSTFGGRLKSSLFKGSLRRNSILKQFLETFGLDEADTGVGSHSGASSPKDKGDRPVSADAVFRKRSNSAGSRNTDLSQIENMSDKALDDIQRLMIQNTSKGASAHAKLSAYQRELAEKRRSISNNQSKHLSAGAQKSQAIFSAQNVFQAHLGPIRTLHACCDGRRVLTSGDDGLVKLWSMPSQKSGTSNSTPQCLRVLRGAASGPVYAAAYVPSEGGGEGSGGFVLSAGLDPAINVWRIGAAGSSTEDESDWSPFTSTQIRTHSDIVWSIVPRSRNSGETLCVGADGFVSFFDVHRFLQHEHAATAAGSANSAQGLLHRFAFESQVSAATPNPTAAAFLESSAAGGCVVAFDTSTLIHFDLETGRRVATLNPDAARPVDLHPYTVVSDPTTGLVFSGHESGDILCWDVRTKQSTASSTSGGRTGNGAGCDFRFPSAHGSAVSSLLLDQVNNSHLLLSGSSDGDLKVWDLRKTATASSGDKLPTATQKVAQAHLGEITGLQQRKHGGELLSSGADGFVRWYQRDQ